MLSRTVPENRWTSIDTYNNCQTIAVWTGIGYAFAALALAVGEKEISVEAVNDADPIDLEAIYEEFYIAPVNASVDLQNFETTAGSYGYDFDLEKVCSYDDKKTNELLNNKDIIRNSRKINAVIKNSKIFREISYEYGSFYNYLKLFTKGETIYEKGIIHNIFCYIIYCSKRIAPNIGNRIF